MGYHGFYDVEVYWSIGQLSLRHIHLTSWLWTFTGDSCFLYFGSGIPFLKSSWALECVSFLSVGSHLDWDHHGKLSVCVFLSEIPFFLKSSWRNFRDSVLIEIAMKWACVCFVSFRFIGDVSVFYGVSLYRHICFWSWCWRSVSSDWSTSEGQPSYSKKVFQKLFLC